MEDLRLSRVAWELEKKLQRGDFVSLEEVGAWLRENVVAGD